MSKLELKQFQWDGVNFLKDRGRSLLADDPGLGKSAQALEAARGKYLLIVSPAMLTGTWLEEIGKWAPERVARWDENGDPVELTAATQWCSYSSLWDRGAKPVALREYLRKMQFDCVIFDEAHNIKSRKAKQTISALQMAKKTPEVYLLTGTPIPNWAHELYMLLRVLDPSDPSLSSYWRWVETWFATWKPPWGGTAISGLRSGLDWPDFYAGNGLDKRMLKRLRDDVLTDLPPLTQQTVTVPMTEEQRKVYDQLKKDYYALIESTGEEIMAFSDGGLHVKLAKATTGLTSLDPKAPPLSSCKIQAMMELIEEREGSPVVVFCHFRNTAAAIEHAVTNLLRKKCSVIMGGVKQSERDRSMKLFQSGNLDVLIGTLETLSEGVTLTRSSTCIFVERSWRPSRNEQAMRRLHRIGQTKPVTVIDIVAANSLDQRMLHVLAEKNDQQMQALQMKQFAEML